MYYVPQEQGDAEMLAERIAPRLQHANSAVVLTCVKVMMYLMNYMKDENDILTFCRKLSPPLGKVTHSLLRTLFVLTLISRYYSHLALIRARSPICGTTKHPACHPTTP
jgi:vesicle coat complex subunit